VNGIRDIATGSSWSQCSDTLLSIADALEEYQNKGEQNE